MMDLRSPFARCVALLVGPFVLAGCGGKRTVGSPSERATANRSAEVQKQDATAPSRLPPGRPVDVEGELREVMAVRDLPRLSPVTGHRIDDHDLVQILEQSFREDMPRQALEGTGTALRALGVVPPDFDYAATVVRLLRADLAGLYDPTYGALFLREQLQGEALRATLLHELVHALQDQHYELGELTRYREDGGDAASALSALAEGDATSAMFDGMLAVHGKTALDLSDDLLLQQFEDATSAADAPPLLRRSLLAPYVDGLRFVQALRRRGGFAEVDRVWRKLPTSTEQILHLDKYDAQELARTVEVPQPPRTPVGLGGHSWKIFFHDVFGEQSLRLVLEEWVSPLDAASAAAGWGGDRAAVYERRGHVGTDRAFAWVIELDPGVEAERLFAAVSRGARARRADALASRASSGIGGNEAAAPALLKAEVCVERPQGAFAAAWKGQRVAIVAHLSQAPPPNEASCPAARRWVTDIFGGAEKAAGSSPARK